MNFNNRFLTNCHHSLSFNTISNKNFFFCSHCSFTNIRYWFWMINMILSLWFCFDNSWKVSGRQLPLKVPVPTSPERDICWVTLALCGTPPFTAMSTSSARKAVAVLGSFVNLSISSFARYFGCKFSSLLGESWNHWQLCIVKNHTTTHRKLRLEQSAATICG